MSLLTTLRRIFLAMKVDEIALLLSFFYCILVCLGSFQLIQVFRSHDSNTSIRNIIVLFLTVSAAFRMIFWVKSSFPCDFPMEFLIVLYFLPVWLDFSGLSGLSLFYSRILFPVEYNKKYPKRILIGFNSIFLLLNIAMCVMINNSRVTDDNQRLISSLYTLYSICLEYLLSFLLLVLGILFQQSASTSIISMLPRSIHTFLMVNWLVVVCYALRGTITALAFRNGAIPASMEHVSFSKYHSTTPPLVFMVFLFTEILPNFGVIMLLWKVSHSNDKSLTTFWSIFGNTDSDEINANSEPSYSIDLKEDLLSADMILERATSRYRDGPAGLAESQEGDQLLSDQPHVMSGPLRGRNFSSQSFESTNKDSFPFDSDNPSNPSAMFPWVGTSVFYSAVPTWGRSSFRSPSPQAAFAERLYSADSMIDSNSNPHCPPNHNNNISDKAITFPSSLTSSGGSIRSSTPSFSVHSSPDISEDSRDSLSQGSITMEEGVSMPKQNKKNKRKKQSAVRVCVDLFIYVH